MCSSRSSLRPDDAQHCASLTCPPSHEGSQVLFFPSPPSAGGGISAHSAGQRPRRGRGRPGGVCAAARAPGSPSEVQNHQGQEGHGPGHVPHLLPAPGEGGWEKGEFRDPKSNVGLKERASVVGFLLVADVPVGRQEEEKEQNIKLPHLH